MTTCNLQSVTKRFGSTDALVDADLTLVPGVTGLLGPNGAGKTTLLRILATTLAPDRGTVSVLGHDIARAAARTAARRRLGYLPQEPGFHRTFTAREFVDYVAILKEHVDRRARRAEVARVLAATDLTAVADRKVKALSGGMRRRLALAQALLGDPDLLVLDEPTAGLDPEQRLKFRELLSVAGQDRTVLLSTHQTEDVAALCSRVVVLDHGRTRFDGTPPELTATAHGRVWHSEERAPGARVAWRTGEGRWRNVGDAPPGADLAQPALEDAYLLLVGWGARDDDRVAA